MISGYRSGRIASELPDRLDMLTPARLARELRLLLFTLDMSSGDSLEETEYTLGVQNPMNTPIAPATTIHKRMVFHFFRTLSTRALMSTEDFLYGISLYSLSSIIIISF